MIFNIFHCIIFKSFFEIGFIDISFPNKKSGFRSLFSFHYEKEKNKIAITFHFLFNFNYRLEKEI
jgi:hypothetical protein